MIKFPSKFLAAVALSSMAFPETIAAPPPPPPPCTITNLCSAVFSIYKAIGGSKTLPPGSYDNCCGWNGIQCAATNTYCNTWSTLDSVILAIDWSDQDLRGSIPSGFVNLTNLQELNLRGNALTGFIPTSILSMTNLATLNLGNNLLSGTLTNEIGKAKSLTGLFLKNNLFSGGIPTAIGNLTSLVSLDLSGNQFTGPIPSSFQNFTSLLNLKLDNNLLTGSIPSVLGQLKSLYALSLSGNLLTGPIPTTLGNLKNITYLSLASNQLSGSIPAELGNLITLQFLFLQQNNLNSIVPSSLGRLTQLRQLYLSNNFLSGFVPSELGNLSLLLALRLDTNNLTGIPSSLSSLSTTKTIVLPNPMTLVPYDVLSRNPSFTFLDTDWANYLSLTPLRKRQSTNSQGSLTADQLLALCPLNNVQSADVPAGCIAGLYNKYCMGITTLDALKQCQSMYDQVFAVSIFSSIGAVCPAWKYGPRSGQCAQAIKTFSYQLPYILVTSDMAANLTANILGSRTYAPCVSMPGMTCNW